jgi:hypothetical protein
LPAISHREHAKLQVLILPNFNTYNDRAKLSLSEYIV